jgi:hypothetical protein
MSNPWDPPFSAPLRTGEKNPDALYLSIGRALSLWEGMEAELGGLYAAFTTGPDDRYIAPTIRAFGTVTNTGARAEMIDHAAEAFFHQLPHELDVGPYQDELKQLLKHYRGWAARRNDVAHGYVTESRHPDYTQDDQPIISTYCLCPSHGHSKKWLLNMEPTYQYVASEVDGFGRAFNELSERIGDFAQKLDELRYLKNDVDAAET